eukprot:4695107-Prymnesium_polylepis.1
MPSEPPSCEREGRARGVRVWQRGRARVAKRASVCGKEGVRAAQTVCVSPLMKTRATCDVRRAACGVRRAACGRA